MSDLPETSDYSRLSIAVNAVVAIAVTVVVLWLASGFAVNFEALFRVSPTVEGGGIGANWESGNEIGWLVAAIKIVHLADVVMGAFILLMVFVHWGAFRRLASQMRPPGGTRAARDGAVTDGGRVDSDDEHRSVANSDDSDDSDDERRSVVTSDDSGASGGDR